MTNKSIQAGIEKLEELKRLSDVNGFESVPSFSVLREILTAMLPDEKDEHLELLARWQRVIESEVARLERCRDEFEDRLARLEEEVEFNKKVTIDLLNKDTEHPTEHQVGCQKRLSDISPCTCKKERPAVDEQKCVASECVLTSYPAQFRCINCSKTWYCHEDVPICNPKPLPSSEFGEEYKERISNVKEFIIKSGEPIPDTISIDRRVAEEFIKEDLNSVNLTNAYIKLLLEIKRALSL